MEATVREAQTVTDYENLVRKKIAESWCVEQESILHIWAEKASGWAWLHDKSSRYFANIENYFVYPSIVLSSISGGLGFAIVGGDGRQDSEPSDSHGITYKVIALFVSAAHILNAILTSFQKFRRAGEKIETHSNMAKKFSSFSRKIVLELSLPPEERKDCVEFCISCKDEYDKLLLDSPSVPDPIIANFKKNFKHVVHRPEVTNGLIHFDIRQSSNTQNLGSQSQDSDDTDVSIISTPANLRHIVTSVN